MKNEWWTGLSRKEYQREYYIKNKSKVLEKQREYHIKKKNDNIDE